MRRAEAGFTLIEVLVALMIAGVMSAILINGASLVERRRAHVADQRKAVFLARSLLSEAAVQSYDPNGATGNTNGLHWTVAQVPELSDPRGQYLLVGIVARVTDKGGRLLFETETRRLKRLGR